MSIKLEGGGVKMPKVNSFDAKGQAKGEFQLDDAVFAADIKEQAVREALLRQLANRRKAKPKVKTYGDVKGGAGKPYRQKGTGRARMGTMRSALRRGGAIALGPMGNSNHVYKLPKKVRRAALRSILSDAVSAQRLTVLENVSFEEPKTKRAVELFDAMNLDEREKLLLVIDDRNENFEKSVRNIPNVKVLLWSNLNPHDLLHFDRLVFFESAVEKVVEVFR